MSAIKVSGAIAFYFAISLSVVFLNKFMFSDAVKLDAPIFLTWTQLVIAVVCCLLRMSLRGSRTLLPSVASALSLIPLTLAFVGMIAFNNLCLKLVEVSFYQVARSLTTCFNIALGIALSSPRVYPSRQIVITCSAVVFGYILGCDGEIRFSWLGVIFGVLSSGFVSLYSIMGWWMERLHDLIPPHLSLSLVKRAQSLPFIKNDDDLLQLWLNILSSMLLPLYIAPAEGGVLLEAMSSGLFSNRQFLRASPFVDKNSYLTPFSPLFLVCASALLVRRYLWISDQYRNVPSDSNDFPVDS